MSELSFTFPSELITSRDNRIVRLARAVRDGLERELIFVEGVRLCEDAARARGLRISTCLFTERAARDERAALLLETINELHRARMLLVGDSVFAHLADTKTAQGIILLAERPKENTDFLDNTNGEARLIVIMHGVANPTNAGAILRAAEAAGAHGVVATRGTVDLYSAKALRGAMGSAFRLPMWTSATFADVAAKCAKQGIRTTILDARATRTHTEVDWRQSRALILGAEGGGLGSDVAADESVRIPMKSPVESLNVAVALGVVLYEAVRQRTKR